MKGTGLVGRLVGLSQWQIARFYTGREERIWGMTISYLGPGSWSINWDHHVVKRRSMFTHAVA